MEGESYAFQAFIAGVLASFACGLGALPLGLPQLRIGDRIGLAYAFAGGLMIAASVYNLLLPAMEVGGRAASSLGPIVLVVAGLLLGAAMMSAVQVAISRNVRSSSATRLVGDRTSLMVFAAMTLHSIPEGVAVGVGYGAEGSLASGEAGDPSLAGLGGLIALAIAIHNIPEGLAVALPMRAAGASIPRCFSAAFLTSLPQPLAAVPASLMVWFFHPLMLPMLGFAAGAMIYLVIVELIPDALETRSPTQTAWAFMFGFSLMMLVQAAL